MIDEDSDIRLSMDKGKGLVAFWSLSDRKIMPEDAPKSRIGAQMSLFKRSTVGPAAYNLHAQSNAVDKCRISKKGYIVGARTAARSKLVPRDLTPDPGAYQNLEIQPVKQSKKPFNTAAKRFCVYSSSITPGVGSYNCDYKNCKRVQYQQSFGRNPVCLPKVKQLSSIKSNTDKLSSTIVEKRYNRRLAYLSLFY